MQDIQVFVTESSWKGFKSLYRKVRIFYSFTK
jgi:hypothetical protein